MPSAVKRRKKTHVSAIDIIRSFVEQFSTSSVSMFANGMVYPTLIAVVPCLTLIYAALNLFGVLDPVVASLEQYVVQIFGEGTGGNLVGYLRMFTAKAMSMGIVSMLSFVLTFVLLIDKVFIVVNKIYHTDNMGNIVIRYLKYIGIVVVGIATITLSVLLFSRFNSLALRLRGLPALSGVRRFFMTIFPYVMTCLLMLAGICLIPSCPVSFASGLFGSVCGTLGLAVLFNVFKFIVGLSVRYSLIYGSLATLLFFFMFLSYMWKIVYAAVVLSYVHQSETVGVEYKL